MVEPDKGGEQRKFPRRGFRARVELVDSVRHSRFSATSVDVNPSGMFIETSRTFQEGELVTVKFPSPIGPYDLCVAGQVLRAHEPTGERSAGVAVEFFGLEPWIFSELSAYVYGAAGERTLLVTVSPPS